MSDSTARPPAPTIRTTQPITKVKTLQELFDHPGLKSRMEELVPKHLDADRMLRTIINATLKTPGLAKASPLSMLGVAMTVGYLGLEPNTPLGLMYLIPFDVNKKVGNAWVYERTDVTPIIGYEGYLDLIARGGFVRDIDCQLIWPGDIWENERGSNRHFKHVERHEPRREDAEPDFAYMFARTTNGGEYLELMSKADVHKIRGLSQGYRTAIAAREEAINKGWRAPKSYTEAPWIKFAPAMWRKTPLRIGQKWIPGRTPQLATASSLDEAGDANRVRFDRVLEAEQVSTGAWEVSEQDAQADQMEQEQGQERPPVNRPTQTQVKTSPPDTAAPRTAARKEAAKQAAPSSEPPPDFDQNAPPPVGQAAAVPAQAAVQTPPTRTNSTAAAAAPAAAPPPPPFDAWLFDATGNETAPYENPLEFARALVELIRREPAMAAALREHNADGIADAMAAGGADVIALFTPPQEATSDPTEPSEDPAEQNAGPGVMVVALQLDRGRPVVKVYREEFKAAVEQLVPTNFLDFIELNRSEMMKVPQSTLSLCLKDLVLHGKAIGVQVPADLGPSLLARGSPKADAASAAALANDAGAEEDPDWQVARNRASDFKTFNTLAELEHYGRGIIMARLVERLEKEGKTEILAWLRQAAAERRGQLRG